MTEVPEKPGRIKKKSDTSFYKHKTYVSMFTAIYDQF